MKRLAFAIGTIFSVITLLFFILRVLPGGPFDEEQALDPQTKARIEKRYGLDQPVAVQFATYVGQLLKGDLGESYRYQEKRVGEILRETLPATLQLGAMALITSYVFGIFFGITSVAPGQKKYAATVQFLANCGSSMPTFLAAPILILVFSFTFDWFPPALWDGPKYYVLPVLALAFRPMSLIVRLVRTSGLENITSDYVRAAQAKGVSGRSIIFKHVLKNSLIPLLAISGSLFAQILSGGFVVEQIFAVPGVAQYFIDSVSNRDYTLVMGLALVYSSMLILFNLLFDLLASRVDPRMRIAK